MAVWRGARPGRARGGKGTKFPRMEVGAEGTGERQGSGAPRPGILDSGVSGRQHSTSYSNLAPTQTRIRPPLHWGPLKSFLASFFSPEAQTLSLWAVTLHTAFQIKFLQLSALSPVPHCPLQLSPSTAVPNLSQKAFLPCTFPSDLEARGRGARYFDVGKQMEVH